MDKNKFLTENDNSDFTLPSMEEIDKGDGMTMLYRVAFSNQLDSLFKYGYNRAFTGSKGGNMYGPGVYCTFKLSDSIHNVQTKPEYGDCIIAMKLLNGFDKFIIFDENLAKSVYGKDWELEKQLLQNGFSANDAQSMTQSCKRIGGALYHGRTAPAAHFLWTSYRKSLFLKYGVRGIIYKGNRDGHCALPYDFSSVIPYSVSFDKGKTFKKKFNEELYNHMKNHTDVEFRFGGKYDEVFHSALGFTLVMNNNKYNFIQHKTDKPISNVWFDTIESTINPNNGMFSFTVNGIKFTATVKPDVDTDDIAVILDADDDAYCEMRDLKDLLQDIKAHNAKSFEQYLEMVEQEDEEENTNESQKHTLKEHIKRLVHESIKRILFEDRTVDNNGKVTIDNFDKVKNMLIKPENADDVWFVQIVKRHKDNPHQYFAKNACEYLASYYIHNVQELEEKEEEIKSVCHATNSRAYIHPNKRSMIKLTDYANNVLKPRFKKYNNKYRMGNELDIAAGQSKDWDDRKLCFLDIDSDDERVYQKVMELLNQHNITPVWEYRSLNNGWHILLPDKNQAKNIDFSVIDNGQKFGRFATVGLEIDKMILLYASLKPNGYGVQQQVQRRRTRR